MSSPDSETQTDTSGAGASAVDPNEQGRTLIVPPANPRDNTPFAAFLRGLCGPCASEPSPDVAAAPSPYRLTHPGDLRRVLAYLNRWAVRVPGGLALTTVLHFLAGFEAWAGDVDESSKLICGGALAILEQWKGWHRECAEDCGRSIGLAEGPVATTVALGYARGRLFEAIGEVLDVVAFTLQASVGPDAIGWASDAWLRAVEHLIVATVVRDAIEGVTSNGQIGSDAWIGFVVAEAGEETAARLVAAENPEMLGAFCRSRLWDPNGFRAASRDLWKHGPSALPMPMRQTRSITMMMANVRPKLNEAEEKVIRERLLGGHEGRSAIERALSDAFPLGEPREEFLARETEPHPPPSAPPARKPNTREVAGIRETVLFCLKPGPKTADELAAFFHERDRSTARDELAALVRVGKVERVDADAGALVYFRLPLRGKP